MSLPLFQVLCFFVLVAACVVDVRTRSRRRRRLATMGVLVVAAWLGEQTAIAAYGYYHYAEGWWLRLGHVPLLVPLIWPLVVLSARDVVEGLWPGGGPWVRALRVGAVVVFDASIIEVCAVAAGFWRWGEGGYFGVPLMGVVGWGCFAFAASLWLEARERRWTWPAAPVLIVAGTHGLLLACWWGVFRWGPRHDLGPVALVGFGVLAAAYAFAVGRARAAGRRLRPAVTLARVLATSVFVLLLFTLAAPHRPWLWVHLGLTAVPYLVASMPLRLAQKDVLGQARR